MTGNSRVARRGLTTSLLTRSSSGACGQFTPVCDLGRIPIGCSGKSEGPETRLSRWLPDGFGQHFPSWEAVFTAQHLPPLRRRGPGGQIARTGEAVMGGEDGDQLVLELPGPIRLATPGSVTRAGCRALPFMACRARG
jgi:hypothetical protein